MPPFEAVRRNLVLWACSVLSATFCETSFRLWKVTSLSLVIQWGPFWLQHKPVILMSVYHCSEGTVGCAVRIETCLRIRHRFETSKASQLSKEKRKVGTFCLILVFFFFSWSWGNFSSSVYFWEGLSLCSRSAGTDMCRAWVRSVMVKKGALAQCTDIVSILKMLGAMNPQGPVSTLVLEHPG